MRKVGGGSRAAWCVMLNDLTVCGLGTLSSGSPPCPTPVATGTPTNSPAVAIGKVVPKCAKYGAIAVTYPPKG